MLAHIDEISGEKRRENLRENADLARISKELATLQRDIDAGVDVTEIADRDARPLAAARGVHALRAARSAAAPRGGARRARRRRRGPRASGASRRRCARASPADLRDAAGDAAGARGAPRGRGACAGRRTAAASVLAGARGDARGAAATRGASGRWSRTTGRRSARRGAALDGDGAPARARAPATRHDGGRLPDRPRAPPAIRSTSCSSRRASSRSSRAATSGMRAQARSRCARWPRAQQRGRSTSSSCAGCSSEVELPLVEVLCRLERAGREARHLPARRDRGRRRRARSSELEHEIWELAGEEFTIGSPQQLSRDPVREAGAVAASAAARPASRPTRACCARSATSTRSSRRSRRWRELSKLKSTYFDALPGADLAGDGPPAHHLQPDRHHHRPPVEHQPEPPEHPDPHGARPPDPQLLHRRATGAA